MREELKNFHDQKQLLMVQFSLVCKQESDYFQNALQENNSNNANTAEVENLKRTIFALREEMDTLKKENSSLKVDKENQSKEHKNDARKIKRLENENKSLESKAKAVKLRHEKELKKLNSRISGKEKTVKYLREKYEMNKISDQFSQKMSTRSTQHRIQTRNKSHPYKSEPFKAPSFKPEAKSEPTEAHSSMKDDEEDAILASPQASQDSQSPLFGDDLTRMLNSDTQQSAVYNTPAAEITWSDEE